MRHQPGRAGVAAAAEPHGAPGTTDRLGQHGCRPWRQYREDRARERREAAKRKRALNRYAEDDDTSDVGADEEALW